MPDRYVARETESIAPRIRYIWRVRFDAYVEQRLLELERSGLLRTPREVEGKTGPLARIDGREILLLCSNDYLGLAVDPEIAGALAGGSAIAGGTSARLVSGTTDAHRAAERALASYVGVESALLFSSGYAANVGAIQALVGPEDLVVSDALNHASLIDGCRLSRAQVRIYAHRDTEHAAALLREHRAGARAALIVTESCFSMEGDQADLTSLQKLAHEFDAGLLVDEAHALGVFGPRGRGLCAELGVMPDLLVGTLGKALGLTGAFVAGPSASIRLLENKARTFVFSTAFSPALARLVPIAVEKAHDAERGRAILHAHADRLRAELHEMGWPVRGQRGPILPIVLGSPRAATQASSWLWELGVFVQAIRPPTVPIDSSRLRIVPTASHTSRHLDAALEAFRNVAARLG